MISTIQHRRIFASRGYGSGGSGSGTGFSGVVNTYSDLPAPASSAGEFYYVQNSQGTSWLPGSMGGTYYPSGVYYSTGTDWITGVSPWQATQAEVDAGMLDTVYVSPKTLANTTLLQNLSITQGVTPITSGIDQGVLFQSGGVLKQSNLFKFDPATGRFNINNVASPTAQINAKTTSDLSSDYFFKLSNSTDSFDVYRFANNGGMRIQSVSTIATMDFIRSNGHNVAGIGMSNNYGYLRIGSNGNTAQFGANGSLDTRELSAGVFGKGKFGIGISPFSGTIMPNENSTNILFFNTGVNPLLNWTTGYQQYSSNNGTFHYPAFRLSDGKVVKLEPADASSITNLTDLVDALKAMGILY